MINALPTICAYYYMYTIYLDGTACWFKPLIIVVPQLAIGPSQGHWLASSTIAYTCITYNLQFHSLTINSYSLCHLLQINEESNLHDYQFHLQREKKLSFNSASWHRANIAKDSSMFITVYCMCACIIILIYNNNIMQPYMVYFIQAMLRFVITKMSLWLSAYWT